VRHEKPTEEIKGLAALYALGSLTQREARSFEAHMQEGCSVCEGEFHKLENVLAGIGYAAGEIPVPDYVRELLMARIEREGPDTASAAEPKKDVKPKPQAHPAPRPFLSQPSREQPSFFSWILAAAFALLALLAFYAYRSAQNVNTELHAKASAAQSDVKDLQVMLDIQKGRVGELESLFSVVSKPDSRILHLAGQDPVSSASGAILWDTHQNQCLIFGYFPLPPEGKAYQLWFLTPTTKIPAGLLKPDPIGRFYTRAAVPRDIPNLAVAVTLEPDNGSQIPTMPFVAIGRSD
jgi:anti-sigma-K factor RskA